MAGWLNEEKSSSHTHNLTFLAWRISS